MPPKKVRVPKLGPDAAFMAGIIRDLLSLLIASSTLSGANLKHDNVDVFAPVARRIEGIVQRLSELWRFET